MLSFCFVFTLSPSIVHAKDGRTSYGDVIGQNAQNASTSFEVNTDGCGLFLFLAVGSQQEGVWTSCQW